MKKAILIALLLLAGVSLAFPQPGYSWSQWYVPGAFVGGALFGAAIARPAYCISATGRLRLPCAGIRIPCAGLWVPLTTDHATIPDIDTMVITVEEAITGIGDKEEFVKQNLC